MIQSFGKVFSSFGVAFVWVDKWCLIASFLTLYSFLSSSNLFESGFVEDLDAKYQTKERKRVNDEANLVKKVTFF